MKRKDYTITDIAEELQTSTASVSRALSGSPGVGEKLRQRILDFCNEVGYSSGTGINLQKSGNDNRTNIVALILGDMRNPFYSDLSFIIQKHLAEHNCMMVLFNSEYDTQKELKFIQMASQYNFAGLILITAQDPSIAAALNELTIPKVLVNRILPNYHGASVLTDNFQAGYEATLHLINLGHKEIGFIKGPDTSSAALQRYNGFCQAMSNYALPVNPEFIWHSNLKLTAGQDNAREYLALKHRPSAVIAINDMTALGFIDICRNAGLRIPDNLSIIGFDDIPLASINGLELTTVSQHLENMGRIASELLIKQFEHPEEEPERVIMNPELIVRKTTKAI